MTKTCSIIATIQKTHHIISMPIKRSSAFSKMKLVAFLLPNSFFLSLKCTLMLKTMKKVEGSEDYENTLIKNEQMHHKMKTIRSQRHKHKQSQRHKQSVAQLFG